MNNKPAPERMCIVCRKMFDKRDLTRIVKTKDGQFHVDKTGKMSGRGAYICHSAECLEKLKKAKLLSKAFKCAVPCEIYEEIEKECKTTN